jgi:hypothetical protein
VYCNGNSDKEAFDAKLEFDIKLLPYVSDDAWVEPTIKAAIMCLESENMPDSGMDCDYCLYRKTVHTVEVMQTSEI